jgi:hypothetical protein
MEVMLLQYSNAEFPIQVTLFGITIDVRLVHSPKAEYPIEVTLSGRAIEVRLEQPRNR